MKVLVTGANGYLGKGIVRELKNEGVEVVEADLFFDELNSNRIVTDIFDLDNPFEYFGKPDVVLHTAWRNGFKQNDDSHMEDLNKHISFLSKLIDSGIKQVAVIGSMHEAGKYEGMLTENTECFPITLYGKAKNELRKVIGEKCIENQTVFQWLRGYYVVGNSESGSSIFSKIYQQAKKGEKTFPFTTGKNKFDFLDYDAFCKYIAYAINQTNIQGIIEICSGKPISLAERVEQFIKDNNFEIKLEYGKFPEREDATKAIWGDNSKIIEIQKNHEK